MKESKDYRKGKVVTIVLGEDKRKRIPRCMDNVYRIVATPTTDGENLEDDETTRLYTLRTVLVEGTSVVDNGRAVNVNGEFEISLEDDGDDSENELLTKTYSDNDEAIVAWRNVSKCERDRVRKWKEKIDALQIRLTNSLEMIETSIKEEQY
jgi:hypothetical protein